ncbi:MAG: hypothetical protein OEW02_12115 [Myxococcales bacterium]|nr:hypothetical protein [Myxococcales bacterium]
MKRATTCLVLISMLWIALAPAGAGAAEDWTLQGPHAWYAGRYAHAMAYIGGDNVLMFAGSYGLDLNDTWIYDLSSDLWSPRYPSNPPLHRLYHAMAYAGGDKVVLFGGTNPYEADYDDTWVYDLSANTWTLMNPTVHPSVRWNHEMVHIGGDQVLLFGGHAGYNNFSDETWIYDLSENTWTLKNPAVKPSARGNHAMAYIGGDKAVIFSGMIDNTGYGGFDNQTWVYDLSDDNWTQQNPPVKPGQRFGHAMAYIGQDQAVLFGGYGPYAGAGGGVYDDTWIYDLGDNTWTQDVDPIGPDPLLDHAMCETSADGSSYPILFAGARDWMRNDFSMDTWTFGGGDWVVGNTPPGTNVEVCDDTAAVCVTFPEVAAGGDTTITLDTCSAPPEGIFLTFTPLCAEITSEADWSGLAEICMPYDDTGLSLAQENALVMVSCDAQGQNCEAITSSRDVDANIVCGLTDHFSLFAIGTPVDSDGDFVPDLQDNCQAELNSSQCDADQDGYGNACDTDFNQSFTTNIVDFGIFKQNYGTPGATDLNCSGSTNIVDFGIFKQRYGLAPGPSGLSCAGTIPCN